MIGRSGLCNVRILKRAHSCKLIPNWTRNRVIIYTYHQQDMESILSTDTIAHLTTFSWSRPIRSKDPFLVCFPVAHTFFKITVWTCWWQWKKNIFSKLSDHFQTSNKEKPVWGSGLIIQQCKVRQAKRGTKKILSIFLSPFFAPVATNWTS